MNSLLAIFYMPPVSCNVGVSVYFPQVRNSYYKTCLLSWLEKQRNYYI